VKARRAGKDVAQLELQSKQSIEPLTVEEGEVVQGAPINPAAVEEFMRDTGLTREQVLDMETVPIGNYDPFRTCVYGQSLVNLDHYSSLGTQMYLLNKWYLKMCEIKEATWVIGRTRPEHYLGYDMLYVAMNYTNY
jgi:hypothetical protein